MDENMHFQLASLVYLVVVAVFFFSKKNLPTLSSRLFKLMCICSIMVLVTDCVTVFCVTHLATVSLGFSYVAHRAYYILLQSFSYLVYLYIYVQTPKKRTAVDLRLIGLTAPYAVAVLCLLYLPINFPERNGVVYSDGPATFLLYAFTAFYILFSMHYTVVHRREIRFNVVVSAIVALVLEIMAALIQFVFPSLFLAGSVTALVCVLLYLSLENPSEYLDKRTDVFNRDGFLSIVSLFLYRRRSFSVTAFQLESYDRISSAFGVDVAERIISDVCSRLRAKHKYLARLDNRTIGFIHLEKPEPALKETEALYKELDTPLFISGIETRLTPYGCFFECPKNASTVEEVMDIINYSIYEARHNRGTNLVTYSEKIVEERKRYYKVVEILDKSIAHDGIDVFYQPIYSVEKGIFTSVEALVRLKDMSIGYISPDEFITIAEKTGHILRLGMIVFEKVCSTIAEHKIDTLGVEHVHINLSGVQCMQENLAEQLHAVMKKYSIRPNLLSLEITETAAMNCDSVLNQSMDKLIDIGSGFSLDDFGSGYSSIGYIIKFPFSEIKLDKGIVWSYFKEDNPKGKTVLVANIAMMKKLNMAVVAEGVETKEQAEELAAIGVDYLQGYFYSKPINEEAYIGFIREKNPVQA